MEENTLAAVSTPQNDAADAKNDQMKPSKNEKKCGWGIKICIIIGALLLLQIPIMVIKVLNIDREKTKPRKGIK